ncbi:ATP phosphoribosyltransferase regulatory subunit [Liberiplasma polymorphum]|uniref:ATP phosphoribosyltransferase regulatory subunit n=1 Tax=Liberiplasma polymorphum TaxID=3374570 RepID=UPI0037714890
MEFLKMEDTLIYYQKKYNMKQLLESIVTKEGYIMVEPAYFEDYDRFITMNKRINKESMVQVINNNGSLLVLRPDATTSIIKELMPKWENGSTLKVFYDSTTFNKASSGIIEEKKQFGVEVLGASASESDVAIVQLALSMLKAFNKQFIIELGNNKFLNGLIEALELSEADEQTLKEIIYYKNQFNLEKFVTKSIKDSIYFELVSDIFKLQGDFKRIDQMLNKYPLNKTMLQGLNELKTLSNQLNDSDIKSFIKFDLAMLSKYDYYNGITFKGYLPNTPSPILSGGRYNPLTKMFGLEIEAIGFSLNTSDLLKEALTNE